MSPAERLAVHETPACHAFALDQRDSTALETVLTEHATWTFEIPGAPAIGPVVGREAILEFARAAWAAETGQRRHHLRLDQIGGEFEGCVSALLRALEYPAGYLLTVLAGAGAADVGHGSSFETKRRMAAFDVIGANRCVVAQTRS